MTIHLRLTVDSIRHSEVIMIIPQILTSLDCADTELSNLQSYKGNKISNQLQQIKKRNVIEEKFQYDTFSLFLKYMK